MELNNTWKKEMIDRIYGEMAEKKTPNEIAMFINYEYWETSYRTLFKYSPDISQWYQYWKDNYTIRNAYLIVNLEKCPMESTPANMQIIDTRNWYSEKDFSIADTLYIQYIYEYFIDHPDVETYVLFSGRWMMESVVRFLKNHGKKVILCGVRGAISSDACRAADKAYIYPLVPKSKIKETILANIEFAQNTDGTIPTFSRTLRAVCKELQLSEPYIKKQMSEYIQEGILVQKKEFLPNGQEIQSLRIAESAA